MIHKIIDNQGKTNKRCLGVLGSTARVKGLANVWKKYGHLFSVIMLDGMIEFAKGEPFTKDDYNMYSRGIAHIGDFLAECAEESIEKKPQQD